jgi:methionyl-tRNA formyltransferase
LKPGWKRNGSIVRIVFLGTADFGIPTLDFLYKKHTIVGVVTTPPRQSGRGRKFTDSPVANHTRTLTGVPVFTPEVLDDPLFVGQLKELAADCFVVVAYRLLPQSIFSLPPLGTINIHASLLPAYRGPAPIHRAIEAGEEVTGVSVFRIDDGIDTGEILRQASLQIGKEETTPELYGRLSHLGVATLDRALQELEEGKCAPQQQDHTKTCRAPKLKKSESLIDWNLSARELFNKIRAFKPFPGTVTLKGATRLGIEWATPIEQTGSAARACGTITSVTGECFNVQTGSGLLRVVSVKPEGKKTMAVSDYLRGTELREGMKFNE